METDDSPRGDTPPTTFTVALAGDVDIARKAELADLVAQYAASDATDVEVDLTAVEFMDSTGLAALVRLDKVAAERDGVLRVVNPTRPVRKVLALSGVAQLLEVVG